MTSPRASAARATPPPYAELQTTTNFTFLHGGSHGEELVAQAKALGLTALAITDQNTLAGVVRAFAAARDLDVKLIVGCRLDMVDSPSLLCLPTDRAAYGRLSRLLSLGKRRAEKGGCRLSLADVAAHAEGQIFIALPPEDWRWCTQVGGGDPVPRAGDARERAASMSTADIRISTGSPWSGGGQILPFPRREPPTVNSRESVGAGRPLDTFEVALRRMQAELPGLRYLAASHRYRGDDRARIAALDALARRLGLRLVATNNVLYHVPHRRPLQDVLTAIRSGLTVFEAGLRLEANSERHLKSPQSMARLFKGFEDALAATIEISDACRFSLSELVYAYPDEPVPPGRSPQEHLEALTWDGAHWRFPEGLSNDVRATIARELALIAQLRYAPYFLTVHDIVAFARARGILCQGRGSAANSVVCYCLGITAVNPAEVDLLFERFVSPERREPPDIDVDFEHDRREEVIQYIYARYGRDRAGLAATVISYRARSAVREVGKAMGLSPDTVAALAGMVWGTRSGGVLPEAHVREAGLDPADPLLARVLELASELTGFPRHLSQHVGGFVLTRDPLVEVVPIGNAAMADRTFIEWDKDDLDTLGLLKVDVLALGMLSCIRRAFDLISAKGGPQLTLAQVPREDPAVYDMLCQADSIGVFQVESRAQMNMLPRLKPRTFYDLVIQVAIVRPGPIQGDMVHPYLRRRAGLEPEDYPAPAPEQGPPDELRRILGKTRGVPLFQEQAMRIAMVAARFTDAEVNELRKAMATFRRVGTIGRLEDKMISAMVARGYDPGFAQRCFSQIKGFGEYGFPESHAASFAHLVYVSSWLKCHHPAAFAAALINAQPMGFYAPAQIVRDAVEHGVVVREPDVNASDWGCTLEPPATPPHKSGDDSGNRRGRTSRASRAGAEGPALRLGLRQIEGLAERDAQAIVDARALGSAGRFRDVHDLWQRSGLAIPVLERLAAADSVRSLGLDRRRALWEVAGLARAGPLPLLEWGRTRDVGAEPVVALPEMTLAAHVVDDYRTLRLSLKAHPVSFLRPRLAARRAIPCAGLGGLKAAARVVVGGVVLVRQRPGTAKGIVFMTLEDETGIANVVVWPKVLERFRRVVMGARLILVEGHIQRHENIIHVVSTRLHDASDWLDALSDLDAQVSIPVANADEVLRPDPGGGRGPRGPVRSGHPRDTRLITKSRDFH